MGVVVGTCVKHHPTNQGNIGHWCASPDPRRSVRITDSPGGINNHPRLFIRAQYGSVDAGYISGGLQPNPAVNQKIVPASWRLLWRALVVLTINIQYTGIAEYFFTSVKNDCIAPSCDHPRAVVSRAQCTVRTFH